MVNGPLLGENGLKGVFFPVVVFGQKFLDFVGRGGYIGHRGIVVHEVDNGSKEFAHVGFYIIRAFQKFRGLGQVCGDYFIEITFFIGFIKGFEAIGKQAESAADEYSFGVHGFQLFGGVNHAAAGRNHIINDNHIFSVNIVP